MRTPKIGDVINGKYEVTGDLGQGGMGIVLAARHRVMNELFALKFFHPSLHAKPELLERLVHEARAGMRIKSPHVAQVHDVDTFEGAPFMVMEYLRGQNLAARLCERKSLPLPEAIDLLLEACEAVNEAHVLGIVHRDLKPGNLFLTTGSNGRPFVKVLDFGISISMDASAADISAVIGSPRYMSPEQLASPRDVDARSDVWALGVILYEMLTGTAPFQGETPAALQEAILGGRHTPIRVRCPDLPPRLERARLRLAASGVVGA